MASTEEQQLDNNPFDEAIDTIVRGSIDDAKLGKWHSSLTTLLEGSRADPAARLRLANPQCLNRLVEFAKQSGSQSIPWPDTDLVYRCIGNACANNDDARLLMAGHGFTYVLTDFDKDRAQSGSIDSELCFLAAKMLYNICCDYEPAQKQCYRDGIHERLIKFLGYDPNVATGSWTDSTVIDLTLWVTSHKSDLEPTLQAPLDEEVLQALDRATRYCNVEGSTDDTCALLEIALAFFRDATVQVQIIDSRQWAVPKYIAIFEAVPIAMLDALVKTAAQDDEVKLVQGLVTSFVWCLSDLSARPRYSKVYPLDSEFTREMIEWIKNECDSCHTSPWYTVMSRTCSNFLIAAKSQAIANMLWASPQQDNAAQLVYDEQLHKALFRRLVEAQRDPENAEVLHAISGLLVHLSRPAVEARECIASDENCILALEVLCKHEMPAVKNDGIRLLRALARDSIPNQERFADLEREVRMAMEVSQTNGGSTNELVPNDESGPS